MYMYMYIATYMYMYSLYPILYSRVQILHVHVGAYIILYMYMYIHVRRYVCSHYVDKGYTLCHVVDKTTCMYVYMYMLHLNFKPWAGF